MAVKFSEFTIGAINADLEIVGFNSATPANVQVSYTDIKTDILAGAITGTVAIGQVPFGSAANTVAGSNNFFWDDANQRLGIGTNSPTTQLTINGAAASSAQLQLKTVNRPNALVFNWLDTPNVGEIWYYGETRFRQNSTGLNLVLSSAGNVLVNSAVDSGERFQVSGNVRINGGLTTSFDISASGNYIRAGFVTTPSVGRESNWNITFTNANNGGVQIVQPNFPTASPNGNVNGLSLSYRFGGATSTFINNSILIDNTINQTSGTGITRGLYINPTLTAAVDWRAIEITAGVSVLAPSTTASATLRVPSGTAPTSPVDGDIWFDGTNLFMRIGGVTKTFTLI